MKSKGLKLFPTLALVAVTHIANANASDDAYFAEMEKYAGQALAHDQQPVKDNTQVIGSGLLEIKKLSPTAYVTYQALRPSYKDEIRKAILGGMDPYNVIGLIFARNSLMSSH